MKDSLTAPPASTTPLALGYAPMDQVHDEMDRLLLYALAADDEALHDHALAMLAHLRSHFEAEDRWMRETEFPARDCHIDEHAAVLASAAAVASPERAADTALARRFFEELAAWFPAHATHLDSALAHWMCSRQFGGKPVVLHRSGR